MQDPGEKDGTTPRRTRVFERLPPRLRRPARIVAGVLLLIGGVLGFLPIVGFWMIPLGLSILAVDIPAAARALARLRAMTRFISAKVRHIRNRNG